MKLFFIVGEDSGDALAAPLIKHLKSVHGDSLKCSGIGGPMMKAEGFDELLPMDQISVMGLWEVLPKIPRLIKINNAIVAEIEKEKPDAVITIDFPDFNFIVAKKLKKRGVYKGKLIHYVSPSVWAWRPGRAKKISEFLDGMMCLFPMEVEYYTKHGLKAEHVGHPLVESGVRDADGQFYRRENDIKPEDKAIGVFFGSRENEFKKISPVICDALELLNDAEKNLHFIAPTLPSMEFHVQKLLRNTDLPVYVSASPLVKWESFKACDVAIAVSGTVALELAYAGVPHIITYKISPITAIILKIMIKVKHVHLANILLEKGVVPEFLQGKCSSGIIAEKIADILHDEEQIAVQKEEFKALDKLLTCADGKMPSVKAGEFIESIVAAK